MLQWAARDSTQRKNARFVTMARPDDFQHGPSCEICFFVADDPVHRIVIQTPLRSKATVVLLRSGVGFPILWTGSTSVKTQIAFQE